MENDLSGDAAERERRIKTKVIGLKDDHDAFDRDYFAALSPAQRMATIPAMFAEQRRKRYVSRRRRTRAYDLRSAASNQRYRPLG